MNTDKIREQLDYGLILMDDETLGRLREARSNALVHYKVHKPAWSIALAGHGLNLPHHPKVGVWLPAAALVIGICAIIYWGTVNHDAQNNDANDVDAALLADDLPVPAYMDSKFFESWLNRSQQ